MKWIPIWRKELKIRARTAKIPILLMFYNAIVILIAMFMMLASVDVGQTGSYVDYSGITGMFVGLSIFQCLVGILVTLVMTSSGISGERERGTMELMMTTPVSAFTMIQGKMMAAITTSLIFAISSLPVLAISSVYGGITWKDIFYMIGLFLVILIYTGSAGTMCSCLIKKSSLSIVVSLLVEAVLYLGPFVILEIVYAFYLGRVQSGIEVAISLDGWVFLLLFSPFILMTGYYDRIMGGSELMELFLYNYGIESETKMYEFLQNYFIPLSILVQLLLSLIFLGIAIKKLEIAPKRGKRIRNFSEKKNL